MQSPTEADRLLSDLKSAPKYNDLYREKKAERNLLFGGSSDSDFRGRKTTALRRTMILYLLSKGKTNIYTLAKNAGTSVNQIERFYAAKLPMEAELVRNLQSFGE